MDDSTLEREIEGLLSVDPAPDFRARVRQRLAQEPPLRTGGRAWRAIWTLAASAVVATAGTTVLLVLRVNAPPPAAIAPEPRPLVRRTLEAPAAPAVDPAVVRSTARTRARQAAVRPMEVIVHAPEAAAWRRLLATIQSGAIDLSPLARAADQSTPLPASEDFVLPQIVIEPLAPELSEQGVRP